MQRLKALNIFSEERGNYTMNATFVEQFRNALIGGYESAPLHDFIVANDLCQDEEVSRIEPSCHY